jgi:hypothetical protein
MTMALDMKSFEFEGFEELSDWEMQEIDGGMTFPQGLIYALGAGITSALGTMAGMYSMGVSNPYMLAVFGFASGAGVGIGTLYASVK